MYYKSSISVNTPHPPPAPCTVHLPVVHICTQLVFDQTGSPEYGGRTPVARGMGHPSDIIHHLGALNVQGPLFLYGPHTVRQNVIGYQDIRQYYSIYSVFRSPLVEGLFKTTASLGQFPNIRRVGGVGVAMMLINLPG